MTEKREDSAKPASARGKATNDPFALPEGLPAPEDDGAADHFEGMRLPTVMLPSTAGREVDVAEVSERGRMIVYCYPLTGVPGIELPEDWDLIPGARGCTPEACSFRDHHEELATGFLASGPAIELATTQAWSVALGGACTISSKALRHALS